MVFHPENRILKIKITKTQKGKEKKMICAIVRDSFFFGMNVQSEAETCSKYIEMNSKKKTYRNLN